MNQPQPQKSKQLLTASLSSTSVTIDPIVKEELLTKQEVTEQIIQLLNKLNAEDRSEIEIPLNLGETDAALIYDVRIVTKNGEALQVKGSNFCSNLIAPTAIGEAPDVMQNLHYSSIWRPLRAKFLDFIQNKSENRRMLPSPESAMSKYDPTKNNPIPKGGQHQDGDTSALSEDD